MAGSANGLLGAGVVLVLLGVAGFASPIFSTREVKDVAVVGDLKLQDTETTDHAIPPLVSAGVLAVGVVLLGAGVSYRRRA